MRALRLSNGPAQLVTMFSVILTGIPLMALAAGLDTTDLLATCHAVMDRFVGSMACSSRA